MTVKFLVFGVPRSGTTFLGHLFNSHPEVFCGLEAFPPHKLSVEQLSADRFRQGGYTESARNHAEQVLSNKPGELAAIGDKYPRSYFKPDEYRKELAKARGFLAIRTACEVFFSFDRRALDPDDHWHSGMRWPVAYLEYLAVFEFIRSLETGRIWALGYRHLTDPEARFDFARSLFECIDCRLTEPVEGFLKASVERTLQSRRRERTPSPLQEALMETEHMRLINTCSEAPLPVAFDYLKGLSEQINAAFLRERSVVDDIWTGILDDEQLGLAICALLRDKHQWLSGAFRSYANTSRPFEQWERAAGLDGRT